MKKIFSMAALFAAGLLGFTSCSNEDLAQGGTPDAQTLASNGIYFKVDDNSAKSSLAKGPLLSRAAGVTTTSLTDIYVQATNSDNSIYFGDGTPELFTIDGSSVFRSTTNHYWPTTGTLNFYASNQQETLVAGTEPKVDDYVCDGIKDWVTATVKAGEKTIPYPLTFQHVLSQIKISAEAKDKTQDLVYKVVGVKLSAPNTGDYTFANATGGSGTWTIDNSSSANYTYEQNMNGQFNPTAATEAEQTWASTDYFNILPVTSGTLTFDVQYQVIQNGQVIGDFTGANSKQVTVDAPNLLSGKIYTYNFVLAINTNDVITFTVSTNSWTDGSTTDVQVPQTIIATATLNNNSVVNIKGFGELTYSLINPYRSNIKSIEITEACSSIGPGAFNSCSLLSQVTIPNTVTNIGQAAFSNCPSLVSLALPSSIITIGKNAFAASGLKDITIPGSVLAIGEKPFDTCLNLETITLSDGVTSIPSVFCSDLASLKTINIPSSVIKIGNGAFQNCTNLTSVSLPGVAAIEPFAFSNCSNITSITLSSNLTSIEDRAFLYCTGLSSLSFNGTKTQWNNITKSPIWYGTGSENPDKNLYIGVSVVHCTDGDVNI